MRCFTKTSTSLVLVLLIVVVFGCQKQRTEQSENIFIDSIMGDIPATSIIDNTISTDNVLDHIGVPFITVAVDDSANKDFATPYSKKLSQLAILEDYAGALQLMPQVKEEILSRAKGNKEEELGMLYSIRSTYIYLYIMLDRVEEAYTIIKEMPCEPPGNIPSYLIYLDNIHVLLHLNKTDEIIVEANKLLSAPDTPLPLELLAFVQLSGAYIINNDKEKALEAILRWKESLLDTPPHFDEKVKRGYVYSMFILEYYLEHLQNEYYVRFRVEKPQPPEVDPLDNERISFTLGGSKFTIISRKDDIELEDESMMNLIREKTASFMKHSHKPEPLSQSPAVPNVDPFPVLDPLLESQANPK